MTERAKLAWQHGYNICDNQLRRIRGPISYETRLLKYVNRGFGIVDLKYGYYKNQLKHDLEENGPSQYQVTPMGYDFLIVD